MPTANHGAARCSNNPLMNGRSNLVCPQQTVVLLLLQRGRAQLFKNGRFNHACPQRTLVLTLLGPALQHTSHLLRSGGHAIMRIELSPVDVSTNIRSDNDSSSSCTRYGNRTASNKPGNRQLLPWQKKHDWSGRADCNLSPPLIMPGPFDAVCISLFKKPNSECAASKGRLEARGEQRVMA